MGGLDDDGDAPCAVADERGAVEPRAIRAEVDELKDRPPGWSAKGRRPYAEAVPGE
jgi:hypothetical protein